MLFCIKWLYSLLYITLFNILEKQRKTDIGLQFPKFSSSPLLKTGVTRAILRSSGKIAFTIDKLNTCSNGL